VELFSPEETLEWGRRIGARLQAGDCLLLHGVLGAGKSVVCRGIAEGVGFRGTTSSPTYAIVNEYDSVPPIFHIDLYRLPVGADWEEIGLEHYLFSEGITLIEWAERLEGFDLEVSGTITIEVTGDESRKITLQWK